MDEPLAFVGGRTYQDLREVSADAAVLGSPGHWVVVQTFEGELTCARFAEAVPGLPRPSAAWEGPPPDAWRSSLERADYLRGVEQVRSAIAAGDVYQVNLCRVLSAPHTLGPAGLLGLAGRLAVGNPSPYGGYVRLPGLEVASASPELFLARRGRTVRSGPIKGTARTAAGLRAKDRAENVMIVDLVRHDLAQVAVTGSVEVERLCAVEAHPGLVHLVSTVRARLRRGAGWAELLAAAGPPGSVSGAPKLSALRLVGELEPVRRGPYCGAVGWVDGASGDGTLAVGIRTFWTGDGRLRFGTGAGITWDSDPAAEWEETELKARRLLALASGPDAQGGESR